MNDHCLRLLLFVIVLLFPYWYAVAGESPVLRVGVTPNFPPLIYKEANKLTGVEVDFANALGEELHRTVKLVELDWEDQIPALAEGRIDIIMSSMSVTQTRQIRVAFAKPYLNVGQTALVRREDASKYMLGFPIRPEGTIGVLKATTGDHLIQQEFSGSKRKTFTSSKDAAKALAKKKIDLFVCDSPVTWWLSGMNESDGLVVVPIYLTQEQLAWAVRKSDAQLLESVNRSLEKMQNDGRALAIIKRWIPLYK
jgi:ABC-type amino acid transport substrate-binding protein